VPDYVAAARQAARAAGIDPDLFVRQINQESGFDPEAGSQAGAQGIAQIVPRWHPGVDPWDPIASLRYAANWMRRLLAQYDGDWATALVHYNGGGGAVQQYLNGTPYAESRQYLTRILGGLGPRVAEAAELPASYVAAGQGGGTTVPSQAMERITSQLAEKRRQLEVARGRAEVLSTPGKTASGQSVEAFADQPNDPSKAIQTQRLARLQGVQAEIKDLQNDVDRLEKEESAERDKATKEEEAAPARAAAAQRTQDAATRAQEAAARAQADFERRQAGPAPRASRTYKAGGVTYTETAPDVGGFAPLPTGIEDPSTSLTAYQRASLPITQQNADTSRLSAAASMLHAQVAKGTLDANVAMRVFDYVAAQAAPVEEGGTLYRAGFNPSNPVRQHFRLDPEPYSVIDAAGFYGRPELNQYVRGSYPFGAGPMSPEEYRARQAGTFQPQPPPGPPPAPMAPASSSAGTMLAAQQVGGFSPQPAMPPPPQPDRPSFGGFPQAGQQDALAARVAQVVDVLTRRGIDPDTATRAARDYLGVGQTVAQTPY